MAAGHWFDSLNVAMVQDADRRGFLRAAGALIAGFALGSLGSLTEAKRKHQANDKEIAAEKNGGKGNGGGKDGKRKRGGKNNKHKKPKPDPTCQAVCDREFDELHPEEIPECVRKCNACRARDAFCVIEGDPEDPTKRATCCENTDKCCQDTHACCPSDSVCCPGYPSTSPKPCCEKDEECCPSDFNGCCYGSQTCCPGEGCVSLRRNHRNCGGCGIQCTDDEACEDSQCKPLPPDACPGRTPCDDYCVDTRRDPKHCGGCRKACRDGQVCRDSKCECASDNCDDCPDGLTKCGDECVDTKTDPRHCGGCSAFNPNGLKCCNGNLCTYINGVCCGGTCYPEGWPSCG